VCPREALLRNRSLPSFTPPCHLTSIHYCRYHLDALPIDLDLCGYSRMRSFSGPNSRSGVQSLGLNGPSLGSQIHPDSYHYAAMTGDPGSGHSLNSSLFPAAEGRSSRPAAMHSEMYSGMTVSGPDEAAFDLLDDCLAPTNFLDTCGEVFGTIPFQQSFMSRGSCDPPFGGRRLAGCTCGLPLQSISSCESSTSLLLADFPRRPSLSAVSPTSVLRQAMFGCGYSNNVLMIMIAASEGSWWLLAEYPQRHIGQNLRSSLSVFRDLHYSRQDAWAFAAPYRKVK
jgi:hypothetical protein